MTKLKKCIITTRNVVMKNKFLNLMIIFFVLLAFITIPKIFAQPEITKNIEIYSEKLNYNERDTGSWKINKSAEWTEKGIAEIMFDVDTVVKNNSKYTDILFVLDVSSSMEGEKLNRVKTDTKDLIKHLLLNKDNHAGIITFDNTSRIISEFTNDEDELMDKIDSLISMGSTNYYDALTSVDYVLKQYTHDEERECIVLFLTDGLPNIGTPNEIAQYSYLKKEYPFVTINGIQYEMGNTILEPLKKITDNQYIADMETLNNVLFTASVYSTIYDNFEITDYIDTNYFYVDSEKNIKVNQGKVDFNKTEQKINWTIEQFRIGTKAKMTIKAKLKDEFIGQGGYYPTNRHEEIRSKIDDIIENIDSPKTPVLSEKYKVTYDGNSPNGCQSTGIPNDQQHFVFDTVEVSKETPVCNGYQFKGWDIITEDVRKINDDYFIMPEKDVILKAKWSKFNITKKTQGTVKETLTLYKKIQQDANDSTKNVKKYGGPTASPNGDQDIYYYYGDVKDNNVIFANYCWRIIRTTETGGVKLLYNGVPSQDGTCDNREEASHLTASQMGTKSARVPFNSQSKFITDVGYMHNINANYETRDPYTVHALTISDSKGIDLYEKDYYYADNYSYNYGRYYMTEPAKYNWKDNYENLIGKYTCRNTSTSCSEISYIIHADSNRMYYLELSEGETVDDKNYEDTITFGESVVSNDDGTYTLSNPITINKLDWYDTYENYKNYWTCGNNSLTCSRSEMKYVINAEYSRILYNKKSEHYLYGNSFTWDGKNYTLTNTKEVINDSIAEDFENHHYTCFNESGICTEVGYLYLLNSSHSPYYLILKDGKSIEEALDDTLYGEDVNTSDSTIKQAIDYWYANNMEEYTPYLEDTIWCNDRSLSDLKGLDPNKPPEGYLYFRTNNLLCKNLNDRFTVDKKNGNGKLTYPVGMLTKEEAGMSSGGGIYASSSFVTGNYYWTMSPREIGLHWSEVSKITYNGEINYSSPSDEYTYVRPAISLHAGIMYTSGDGSVNSPYIIGMEKANDKYEITIEENKNYTVSSFSAYENQEVKLISEIENYSVKSFKMNGNLKNGNKFLMPDEDVKITDVKLEFNSTVVIESYHDPYDNDLNEVKEKSFEGATYLSVELEYQTYYIDRDFIYLYDSSNKRYGKYGGTEKKTEIIKIPGNYLKILFQTDSVYNDMYGYKATITPHYEKLQKVNIEEGSNAVANYLSGWEGLEVKLTSTLTEYFVKSFKMNGKTITGDTFIMPNKDASITDVELQNGVIIETEHYPYLYPDNELADEKEKYFAGATSLFVELEYQTESIYADYISLYDRTNKSYGTYGGPNKKTETIRIFGDYLKILFQTESGYNDKYGYKATIIPSYDKLKTINIEKNANAVANYTSGWKGLEVKLSSTVDNYIVKSFKMNGTPIVGDTFKIPNKDVMITDVVLEIDPSIIVESEHNPYPNNLNDVIEKTLPLAKSLEIRLEYQTESKNFDYIYLYDQAGNSYGPFGGEENTELIKIPGDYVKIEFVTDSSVNSYYGYKAKITPKY